MKVEIKQNHKLTWYWTVLVNNESVYSSEEFDSEYSCKANIKNFIVAMQKCLE